VPHIKDIVDNEFCIVDKKNYFESLPKEKKEKIVETYIKSCVAVINSKLKGNIKMDNVNHPPHYNNSKAHCECKRRIECIDITRHFNFNLGNAIKYIWRCDLKEESIEQLKKAIWYLNDEIARREEERRIEREKYNGSILTSDGSLHNET
jgi:Protein of unknwon function (DUF3310)